MIEILIVAALAGLGAMAVGAVRRAALRRARLRAEAMLDELAAAACAALADGHERRCARAVERYERAGERVAAARTRRELDMLVARHRLRQGAIRAATRGLERVRDLIGEAVPVRR